MDTTHRHRDLAIEVVPYFTALADLRRQVRAWLGVVEVPDGVVDDLVLVATELCTNAIEATPDEQPVSLLATYDDVAVRFSVGNAASGDAPSDLPILELGSLQERGRGLSIVRALVDSLTMSSTAGRTVVRARLTV